MGDRGVEPIPSSSSSLNYSEGDLKCTICLSAQFSQESRVNGCNHSFCFTCITEWLCQSVRPSCPMCRFAVDKILYNLVERNGQKEIGIVEVRSGHLSLTPTDRQQLLSERRVVVRNLVHSYKVARLLSSDIADIEGSEEPDDALKAKLTELTGIVSSHIQSAESCLIDLRTENVRNDKSLVFDTPTFRRMIYTDKIKVKWMDTKKPKLTPSDISKDPERFRRIVINFLVNEFDAVPYGTQEKIADCQWRTKFLGGSIGSDEKHKFASEIYDLMLTFPTGNEDFQKKLNDILVPINASYIRVLDDHLSAIVALEKTDIRDFYNLVYYDSIYNNISQTYLHYQAMLHPLEDSQRRFEVIIAQLHREMDPREPIDWRNPFSHLQRFAANRNEADRPANNDGNNDRSSSPEERVPTPMPEEDPREHNFARAYFESFLDVPRTERPRHILRTEIPSEERDQEMPMRLSGNRAFLEERPAVRTRWSLRSSARRGDLSRENADEIVTPVEARPHSRRETNRSRVSQRIRDLDSRSTIISRDMQSSGRDLNAMVNTRFAGIQLPGEVQITIRTSDDTTPVVPIYRPGSPPSASSIRNSVGGYTASRRRNYNASRSENSSRNQTDEQIIAPSTRSSTHRQNERTVAEISEEINQEDADNGLDYISVAHRTRAARRAANNGQLPGAPPQKRSNVSRRNRH